MSRREGATAAAATAAVVGKGGDAPRSRHPRRARRHSRGLPSGRSSATSARASTAPSAAAPSAAAPQYRLSTAAPRSACLKGRAPSHGEERRGVGGGGERGVRFPPLSYSFPSFFTSLRSSELDVQSVLLARRSAEPGRLKASPPAVAQCKKPRRESLPPVTASAGPLSPRYYLLVCCPPRPPPAPPPSCSPPPPPSPHTHLPLSASLRWLSACPRHERMARPGCAAGNWQGWRSEEVRSFPPPSHPFV